jgi:integrase
LCESGPPRKYAKATLAHRDITVRQFFGDLVHSGVEPDRITSLAVLVDPENVKRGLKVRIERRGEVTQTHHIIALILMSIARDYVGLPEADLSKLRDICRRLRRPRMGMKPKTRERLRQFDDPEHVQQILRLPDRLMKEARSGRLSPRRAALLAEVALAIEIEILTAIRIQNLAAIHLDHHICWSRALREGMCHLVFEADEVKNKQPLEFELDDRAVRLLKDFLEKFRPTLAPASCRWLFARRGEDGPVDRAVLSGRIKDTIREFTGLIVNIHLFRALVGKLYLEQNPGGYEVVRRVLGHTSLATTTRFYTGTESVSVARHFDGVIRRIQTEGSGRPVARRRRP